MEDGLTKLFWNKGATDVELFCSVRAYVKFGAKFIMMSCCCNSCEPDWIEISKVLKKKSFLLLTFLFSNILIKTLTESPDITILHKC